MSKRLTTEEFIRRAREVHGDKYDYSKTEYNGKEEKVCIICPVHGEFWQRASSHMRGVGCSRCYYENRLSNTSDFIKKAKALWGDRFDYSLVEYKDSKSKIKVICHKHGVWESTPNRLLRGCGCPKCKSTSHRKKVYGLGVVLTDDYVCNETAYSVWRDMLRRCYTDNIKCYNECTVCEDWLIYDTFRDWFIPRYKEGWELDKDWIGGNNKVYSPQTCFVLPKELNLLIVNKRGKNNGLPVGVYYDKRPKRYYPVLCVNGRNVIREGGFETPEEAFAIYKKYKESHIRAVVDKYKDQLEPEVYNMLIKYHVE